MDASGTRESCSSILFLRGPRRAAKIAVYITNPIFPSKSLDYREITKPIYVANRPLSALQETVAAKFTITHAPRMRDSHERPPRTARPVNSPDCTSEADRSNFIASRGRPESWVHCPVIKLSSSPASARRRCARCCWPIWALTSCGSTGPKTPPSASRSRPSTACSAAAANPSLSISRNPKASPPR